jgi:hypothetical protein
VIKAVRSQFLQFSSLVLHCPVFYAIATLNKNLIAN